jgi:putative transposase
MPDYRRANVLGGTYFFTLAAFDRRPFLTTDLARCCLRSALTEVRRQCPFQVEAVCLLPEHLHCIWRLPAGDADFSGRWRDVKGLFSKRYLANGGQETTRNKSRRQRGEAAVWQRRFWEHLIRDENDYYRHLDYIHFNPVKHGHVSRPSDWQWSSIHRYVQMGWYDTERGVQEPDTVKGLICVGE